MADECPLCEKPASATASISMGQSWTDTFGKPPHSLFSDYPMIHVASTQGGMTAFLHTERDLQ